MRNVYLDHTAATPVNPEVVEAMLPYFDRHFGNPQSLHGFGEEPKRAIDEARASVADLIGAAPGEIYFTSSGTESNNFALRGLALANRKRGDHVVLSAIEHQSVLHAAKSLEGAGFRTTLVPVDRLGMVDPGDVAKAITDGTILVSVMYANSEVGTVQPIREISAIVKERSALFHTDAVGAAGVIPVDVGEIPVDGLSLAGSRFYGPKGAAALYVRKGTRILPFIDGGIQEEGRRAGTENVPGIVGFGKAAALAKRELSARGGDTRTLRDRLVAGLTGKIEHLYLTGHPEHRLPNHASFAVEFIEGEAMLLRLSMAGVSVSSGSACTSRALKTSHVLTAMGVPAVLAQGSIVFALGAGNSEEDIDYVVETFPPIVQTLRMMSPLYSNYLREKESK